MPFILQCPHCTKYMILEDQQRGCRVKCLNPGCPQWIDQEPSGSGERGGSGERSGSGREDPPPLGPAIGPPPVPTARRHKVVQCPHCSSRLRVPPADRSQRIHCPNCNRVFQG